MKMNIFETSQPRIDVLDFASFTLGNVFYGLVMRRYDSDALGNGLGSDWMVARHHYDLDASRAALGDRVWNSGSWWIDHRHEADETKTSQREIRFFAVEVEALQ